MANEVRDTFACGSWTGLLPVWYQLGATWGYRCCTYSDRWCGTTSSWCSLALCSWCPCSSSLLCRSVGAMPAARPSWTCFCGARATSGTTERAPEFLHPLGVVARSPGVLNRRPHHLSPLGRTPGAVDRTHGR